MTAVETSGGAPQEELPLDVNSIQVQLARVENSADIEVLASYDLELKTAAQRIFLLDPGHLNVLSTSLSMGAHVERGRARGTDGALMAAIDLTPTRGDFSGRLELKNESRWTSALRERRNGSPVLTFPDDLPAVAHGYHLFDASPMRVDAPSRRLPSVSVRSSWEAFSGEVRNADGMPTMQAVFARPSVSTAWYADERLVLVGDALVDESAELRAALRDLLVEIHGFFGDLYGNAHRVRVLGVAEAGAFYYRHLTGQYCPLDKQWIRRLPDGWFPAARLFAREIAAMWWCYGLRPVGAYGAEMGFGLAMAATMHWLRASHRKDDLRTEFGAAELLASKGNVAGSVALAVAMAAASDNSVHTRLREFCTAHWGMAVPYSRIAALLSEMGIGLPKALLQSPKPSRSTATPLFQRVSRQIVRLFGS
jgi:hypothetical protein